MNDCSLYDLAPGERARIRTMELTGGMRRRLRDVGLTEGTVVECLGVSPGGDPKAYRIRGAAIALRGTDGRRIRVDRL